MGCRRVRLKKGESLSPYLLQPHYRGWIENGEAFIERTGAQAPCSLQQEADGDCSVPCVASHTGSTHTICSGARPLSPMDLAVIMCAPTPYVRDGVLAHR